MVLTTLQTTTGVSIAGGATVSTVGVAGHPVSKDGDDFIVDTGVLKKDITSSLVVTGATMAINSLSGLSAKATEINDTKSYVESLSDEELARLCEIDVPEITSSPKKLVK